MTSYIIDEEQLNLALDDMLEFCKSGELKKVRSTNLETELRKEREKVIDWMTQLNVFIEDPSSSENHLTAWNYLKRHLESLRDKTTITTEPKQPICPWCFKDHKKKNPLSWDQFKEIWVCSSHGKFDESQLKNGV